MKTSPSTPADLLHVALLDLDVLVRAMPGLSLIAEARDQIEEAIELDRRRWLLLRDRLCTVIDALCHLLDQIESELGEHATEQSLSGAVFTYAALDRYRKRAARGTMLASGVVADQGRGEHGA